MLALDSPEITDPAADISTCVLSKLGGKFSFGCHLESTVSDGFNRCYHCVMNKGTHFARLFLCNELQWVEVFYFASKSYGESFSAKLLDVVSATAATHERSPGICDRIANGSDKTEAGNHDTTCQVKAPC